MWNILSKIQKNLILILPVAIILGIIFGNLTDPSFLKQLIIPFTILMIYPSMVTLKFKGLFSKCNIKLLTISQLVNFIVIPIIGYTLGIIFFKDQPYFAFGLFLISLLPTGSMTIAWTGFAKGNVNSAIKLTIIGLILGSVLTPIYAKLFMGTVITISFLNTFKTIAIVVFIPMILGYITQRLLIKKFSQEHFQTNIKPKFPAISSLGVISIIFSAIALKAKAIVAQPLLIPKLLIPILIYYILNYAITTFIGKYYLEPKDAIPLIYGSSLRNLSIALAIAITVFKEQGTQIALIISLAYIVQIKSAAIYLKVIKKVFNT